jgi:serine/threonine-protein kinase RsbT
MITPPEIELHAPLRQPMCNEHDVVVACQKGRTMAESLGFSRDDQVVFVIVISELSHNILKYARCGGTIILYRASRAGAERDEGLFIEAQDEGPGIPDVDLALTDGYSTGGGLGMGLSGVKRLMDDFDITSQVGEGTTILTGKWLGREDK